MYKRQDVGLIALRCVRRKIDRLLHRVVSLLVSLGIGGIVIVWSYRFRNAPVRHRQPRIKFSRMLKRTCRFVVVKCINETQTLIEELLRLRVMRGNRMVRISDSSDQLDRSALSMHCVILSHGHSQE